MSVLRVSEVFGPTVQGEGPSAGRRAVFLRLGGCNLDCTWCDTPYTWDWRGKNGTVYDPQVELRQLDVWDVAERLLDLVGPMAPAMVVVTGGEPLLQARGVEQLVLRLAELWPFGDGVRVEVETNGTRAPAGELRDLVAWNVSPKLAHSGVAPAHRYSPQALDVLVEECAEVAFKFVCRDRTDLDEVEQLVEAHAIDPQDVWIMPEGRDSDTLRSVGTQRLADEAVAMGWNVSSRLHVLLWGDERGR